MPFEKEKTCGICGNRFLCGSMGGCWCTNVKVTSAKRHIISRLTDECVCPGCLEK
ncbi:MAG: cysteine-rich CWC family protein [Candidatus Thermoplasmatota archaeon]|nr:cysteine-rich CWC family protein [Candidatus Thermoplasmatota archaeon]MCL5889239.1 cysteine-rich CWC family protein [Candidatus Thermoplasmatota archaeon]